MACTAAAAACSSERCAVTKDQETMMECRALHIYAVEAPRIESMEIMMDSAAPKKEGRDVLSIARRRTATLYSGPAW
jgi:hypothetical protein